MTDMQKAEEIAESLRQEPYSLLKNNCISKSVRFRRMCKSEDIPARLVICLGLSETRLLGRRVVIPVIHGWGDVGGKRFETSRPLGSSGLLGIVPANIQPVITMRL